jgi:putative DNA primase/helicase
MNLNNIPNELKELRQWVCTTSSKIPLNPLDGTYADVSNSSTWGTYQDAVEAIEDNEEVTHLGFVFTEHDPYCGIDLDNISDNLPFADGIAENLDSYTEFSKSGNGLHIIVKAELPVKAMKTTLEIKYSGAYLILTGDLYKDFDNIIEERQEEITALYERYKKGDSDVFMVSGKYCLKEDIPHRLNEALADVSFRSYYLGERPSSDESSNDMGFMSKIVEWFGRDYEVCREVLIDTPYFMSKDEAHKNKILNRDDYLQNTYNACASTIERTQYEIPKIKIITVDGKPIADDEPETVTNFISDLGDLNNPPEWVKVEYTSDGIVKNVTIDEPQFCKWFKNSTALYRIHDNWYSIDGLVPDDYVENVIQRCVERFMATGIAAKVSSLAQSCKRACYLDPPIPSPDKVFFKNGGFKVTSDGELIPINNEFTLNRLNVEYDENAKCPLWDKVLHELLNDDDIITLQQYLGYCMIPTTKAQYALFLIGNGGEGKSVVNTVISRIFSNSSIHGRIEDIDGNRFFCSELENKLLMLVDDLPTTRLEASSLIKTVITASQPLRVEGKGVKGYSISPYARIFGCGNNMLRCRDDISDGFYRRMIHIQVKPKTRTKDDRLLVEKLLKEKSGIFNWLLDGLKMMVKNKYELNITDGIALTQNRIKNDSINVLEYIFFSGAIVKDPDGTITCADFYDSYLIWCSHNALTPMKPKSVSRYLNHNLTHDGITGGYIKDSDRKTCRCYFGIRYSTDYSFTKKSFTLSTSHHRIEDTED